METKIEEKQVLNDSQKDFIAEMIEEDAEMQEKMFEEIFTNKSNENGNN